MMNISASILRLSVLASAVLLFSHCSHGPVTQINEKNASGATIANESRRAVDDLYKKNARARDLANRSKAVLVFPEITSAGFVVGGQAGNGALLVPGGDVSKYYQTSGLSYGLQAGAQKYGYVLFLMNDKAVAELDRRGGWEFSGSTSVTVLDSGVADSLTERELGKDAYAMFFDQKGLMAGVSLQGTKITRIYPNR
ncbi:YSC84-related protein [Haloferula chungangensis]|uniref:YSC84-related protein n=1 Tax=Haloferula chungangensis TaxID=1048331 RepID=A0ABW2L894_9BACT